MKWFGPDQLKQIANADRSVDEKSSSTLSRRCFISYGFRFGAGAAFGSFLAPLKSLATVFNTGAFFKRQSVVTTGGLWAAGSNAYGEIGDSTVAAKSSPIQVGALTTWAKAAGGLNYAAAIRADGTMWCWGMGTSGQIGNGAALSVSSPVQVGTGTYWSKVSCGHNGHTLAIRTDGTLWAWGLGTSFQLATSGNRSSPTQIGNLTTWQSVAAGGAFSVALKTDGTLWVWGVNNYGQLGLGVGTS